GDPHTMDSQGPPSSVDVSNPEGPTPDPGESPGAEAPPLHRISEQTLLRGDRVLFFTDGLIEEHEKGGEQFGEERLINFIENIRGKSIREMVRDLSHALMRERRGITTDDATLFLIEWRGGTADHLASIDI
ncbi:SpoIIE family protein phosphatase, partial [Parafrankia sp. FMc6]|uniref:SpoIIE family protein phosphatase n=1 Tax=Parafrankia soli TaxID=2599596 RepID=UPI0034D47285